MAVAQRSGRFFAPCARSVSAHGGNRANATLNRFFATLRYANATVSVAGPPLLSGMSEAMKKFYEFEQAKILARMEKESASSNTLNTPSSTNTSNNTSSSG
ncbi:hypothetical protein PGT21_010754 [Puccinia graminis f. sp. tritici]|uniref:Uncharacterized protein n=1 Tax=Puccinia graminis f. sp. tritici TaxID=56615 RepID=A0A5B0NHR4_PUCGR|nr:hypothetical protein PGTUg99_033022 [Puccinia graminis f. sp. tritici]KAA1097550.1 hypothetical protein PGT21_011117 [Puccinia graminis f. sp. tritici]KAA1101198.1 hypothetical protein PGT21_010754 [Puccinia graminis f. sp. tritici]KAA1134074.1 hypothetical protein PGTUg99_024277 [Puccinia graminis f. sp. tritici]